jgi:hypothetical protein
VVGTELVNAMKQMTGKFLEACRLTTGRLASDKSYGFNGAFLPIDEAGTRFKVICSDGMGWEHVSVSLPDRCPTWDEMCWIKSLFWDAHECVVQYHPPEREYVNNHAYCLHLWRPTDQRMPTPPQFMVGVKDLGQLAAV